MSRNVRGLLLLLLPSSVGVMQAQGITRDNYYHMVPPPPPIVGQTRASEALHLYGDRARAEYRDVDPVDGIDDRRGTMLKRLADRFSPIIRPNNFSLPRDPRDVIRDNAMLQVDRWENGVRTATEEIQIFDGVTPVGDTAGHVRTPDAHMARLRSLYRRRSPRTPRLAIASPEVDVDEILFFDLPGSEPKTWRASARDMAHLPTRIFAHPFIYEDSTIPGAARYLLVMQYWFFFTFNNSVNNHEGDWEHINVQITTRAHMQPGANGRSNPMLTRDELLRMLDPSSAEDSTVIAAVEYHFHHLVMTLDYLNREVVPVDGAARHRHGTSVWEDGHHIRRAIDARLTAANGKLATHPIVFTGGNYKGPIELFDVVPRFTASLRRNSDGAYPFAGTWQAVGPLAYIEQVHGHVTPPLKRDSSGAWHSIIADPDYFVYHGDDVIMMPDWERLEPIVHENDALLALWGWMLMPVHWGFPASPSIGAGAVKHTDLGNLAPFAPSYKAQWNHVGLSSDRQRYDPIVLRTPVSPTTPWTMLRSGWGILNIPLALWGLMPGYNVLLVELMPWLGGTMHTLGVPPPRTFTAARLPHRVTTAGVGAVWDLGGEDFARLVDTAGALGRSGGPGSRFWIALFFDDRLALENTYSTQTTTIIRGTAQAQLDQRQLTGGIRFTPSALTSGDHAFHAYGRAGYGWLWLRARDALATPSLDVRDGHLPTLLPSESWWPNTWYAGMGIEAFAPPTMWLLGKLGYGLRLESSRYFYRLTDSRNNRFRTHRSDLAVSLVFGW